MEFTVPKFIERKPRIVGPLTFKQFIIIGTAGGICFFLYFIIPSLVTFIIAATFLLGVVGALAFFKIGETPLPVVIKNLFIFLLNPKVYLWKKKAAPPKVLKEEKEKEEEEEKKGKKSPLKIAGYSRLKELSTRIEAKSK